VQFTTSVSLRASHVGKVNGAVNGTVNGGFRAPFTVCAPNCVAKIAEGTVDLGELLVPLENR
jgi:hypothetical protein